MDIETRIRLFNLPPAVADVLHRVEAALADPERTYAREPLPAGIDRDTAERLAEALRMDGGRIVELQMDGDRHHVYAHDPRLTIRMRPKLYTRLLSLGVGERNARRIGEALKAQHAAETAAAEAYVAAMRAASRLTD